MSTKEIKREEAITRQKLRNDRSNQQQLTILDQRLGTGLGAYKERMKLLSSN